MHRMLRGTQTTENQGEAAIAGSVDYRSRLFGRATCLTRLSAPVGFCFKGIEQTDR